MRLTVQIHSSESARESLETTAVRDVCAHHEWAVFHFPLFSPLRRSKNRKNAANPEFCELDCKLPNLRTWVRSAFVDPSQQQLSELIYRGFFVWSSHSGPFWNPSNIYPSLNQPLSEL